MIHNIKKISDLLKIEDQRRDFDKDIFSIIDIIKKELNLDLNKKNIFIKNNVVKIKTISNIRFLILLKFDKINNEIKSLNKTLILEL
jgi:hypothetical protein